MQLNLEVSARRPRRGAEGLCSGGQKTINHRVLRAPQWWRRTGEGLGELAVRLVIIEGRVALYVFCSFGPTAPLRGRRRPSGLTEIIEGRVTFYVFCSLRRTAQAR